MKQTMTGRRMISFALSSVMTCALFSTLMNGAAAQTPEPPSETPAQLVPTNDGFEYVRREVMIPMRDGVKLHTVILVPNGARRAPILLTRTPYNASALRSHAESSHLGPILTGYDNATEVIVEGGYIRVVQDVRASTDPKVTM